MSVLDTRLKGAFLVLSCLLLLGGCATMQTRTVELSTREQEEVLSRFEGFLREQCGGALDADLSLEFTLLGRIRHITGMIQARTPAFLRYSTIGPLGRPLNIMVTDGENYTLVDNRAGKAYVGPVGSDVWNRYVPEALHVGDVLPLLTGRLPGLDASVMDVRGDAGDPRVAWIFMKPVEGTRRAILFDRDRGVILRSRLFSEGGGPPLIDVVYGDYDLYPPGCRIPGRIQVQGSSISGSLLIRLDRVYPGPGPAPARFQLTIPEHYTVEKNG